MESAAREQAGYREISKMELTNRHYLMVNLMGKKRFTDYFKLFVFEMWAVVTGIANKRGWQNLIPALSGKFSALYQLLTTRNK
jgi:hypothetical protein